MAASNSNLHLRSSKDEEDILTENFFKRLERFGLTRNQSKVFLHLTKNGPCTANEITKFLKLPRTETYTILQQLLNRGITIGKFGKPNKYDSLPFSKTVSILLENEKNRIVELSKQGDELIELWEKIPITNFHDEKLIDNRFQVLKGMNPILGKIRHMANRTQDEILVLGADDDFLKFYHTDLFKIIKSKKNLKVLVSCSEQTKYIFDELPRDKIRNFNDPMAEELFFIVKDGKETIFLMNTSNEEISAIWTESKSVLKSLNLLFNLVWAKSDSLQGEQEEPEYLEKRLRELEQEKKVIEFIKNYGK